MSESRSLRLELFGGPRLFAGEEEIPLSPFQACVLALVYGHGERGVSVDRIASMLWQEDDSPPVRARIRQLLYTIRTRAGGHEVIARTHHRLLPAEGVECDYVRVDLWHQDADALLTHLMPSRISREVEDWIAGLRAGLDRHRRECVIQELLAVRGPSTAIEARNRAEGILATDPLNGYLIEQVTSALLSVGLFSEAKAFLNRREKCARLLDPEWRRPATAVSALEAAERAAMTSHPPQSPTSSQIVGRITEVEQLQDLLVPSGELRSVLLLGEAGVGKTRVLQELMTRLTARGVRTVMASCRECETGISLNLVGDLLRGPQASEAWRDLDSPWREIAVLTFPFLSEPGSQTDPVQRKIPAEATARRTYETVERLFRGLFLAGPLVVLIDDAHWIDDSSASCIAFLHRRLKQAPVSFLFALRPEELSANPGASRLVNHLKQTTCSSYLLRELSVAHTKDLIRQLVPSSDESHIERIAEASRGLPLVAVELSNEDGDQVSDVSLPVKSRIALVISGRRSRLSDSANRVLEILSVFGRAVQHSDIRKASGLTNVAYAYALSELLHQRLVIERDNGIGLRHDLIRSVVYSQIPRSARGILHRVVAKNLETGEDSSAAELAFHYDAAGSSREAFLHASSAASDASQRGAFGERGKLLEIAVRNAPDETSAGNLEAQLAESRYLLGETGSAMHGFRQAAERLNKTGQRTRARLCRVRALHLTVEDGHERPAASLSALWEIAEEARGEGDHLSQLRALDEIIRLADYGLDNETACRALKAVDAVSDRVEGRADVDVQCLLHTIRTRHVCYGSPKIATLAAQAAVELAEQHGLHDLLGPALKRFLVVFTYRGLLETREASRILSRTQQLHERNGDVRSLFDVIINLAAWHIDVGRLDRAETLLRDAAHIVRNLEGTSEAKVFYANLAEFYLYSGDYLTGRRYFDQACTFDSAHRRSATYVTLAGSGLCAAETGELSRGGELDRMIPCEDELLHPVTFDPTLIALLRSRLLELRGRRADAIELISLYRQAVEETIVPAYLKLLVRELELRRKHGTVSEITDLVARAVTLTNRLGLERRASRLAEFL